MTSAWVSEVLGHEVRVAAVDPLGTGQMSDSFRVVLREGGPASVVVKIAAADPTSRETGVRLGVYAREVRFYSEIAPTIGAPLPECLHAAYDAQDGWFVLLLEDLAPAVVGDQLAGCSASEAGLALDALAALQAAAWDDPAIASRGFLTRRSALDSALLLRLLPGFLARYGDALSIEHRGLIERFVSRIDAWAAARDRRTLVHGDFRLDNLLFGASTAGRPVTIVDWQSVQWSAPLVDVAYFVSSALTVEERRAHEQGLLRRYHEALLARGVAGFSWEACWEGYRREALFGVLMMTASPMLVQRTQRGDEMFMRSLARHAQHAIDLGSLELGS